MDFRVGVPVFWAVLLASALSAALLFASGCARFEPVDVSGPPAPRIDETRLRVGDTVEVVTLDQKRLRFKLTSFDGQSLRGPDVTLRADQLRSIAVQRYGILGPGAGQPDSGFGVAGALAGAVVAVLILVAVL